MAKEIIIRAKTLFDGKGKKNDKTIVIKNGIITDILSKRIKPDFEGFVTPGFIDAHSHIGMDREGEPWQEGETNDVIDQFLPMNDPVDSIYFDDRAFTDAVNYGVLYSCLVPGSGNLIGGKAKVIRNFAEFRDEAVIKDYGYKMALGFNPRSTTDWKGIRPSTRMGIYSMLEKKFNDILNKRDKENLKKEKAINDLNQKLKEKKIKKDEYQKQLGFINREYQLAFDNNDNAILEILDAKKTVKVHVHKDDDILYLIKLVNQFGLKVTVDHAGDVFHKDIFDKLAKNNIPIVYGPLGSVGYKVELKHAYFENTKLLMDSKANYGLMTDHPVVHSICLRDSLKFFMVQGMKDHEAISLITHKNAQILGIDDILGSIETERTASILVWDEHPLYLGSYPRTVIAEGKIIRK